MDIRKFLTIDGKRKLETSDTNPASPQKKQKQESDTSLTSSPNLSKSPFFKRKETASSDSSHSTPPQHISPVANSSPNLSKVQILPSVGTPHNAQQNTSDQMESSNNANLTAFPSPSNATTNSSLNNVQIKNETVIRSSIAKNNSNQDSNFQTGSNSTAPKSILSPNVSRPSSNHLQTSQNQSPPNPHTSINTIKQENHTTNTLNNSNQVQATMDPNKSQNKLQPIIPIANSISPQNMQAKLKTSPSQIIQPVKMLPNQQSNQTTPMKVSNQINLSTTPPNKVNMVANPSNQSSVITTPPNMVTTTPSNQQSNPTTPIKHSNQNNSMSPPNQQSNSNSMNTDSHAEQSNHAITIPPPNQQQDQPIVITNPNVSTNFKFMPGMVFRSEQFPSKSTAAKPQSNIGRTNSTSANMQQTTKSDPPPIQSFISTNSKNTIVYNTSAEEATKKQLANQTISSKKKIQTKTYAANKETNSFVEEQERQFNPSDNTTRFKFMVDIRDAFQRKPSDPNYDPTTLYISNAEEAKLTPFERQYWNIKKRNFDTVLFFKKGKFYELFETDSDIGQKHLGLRMSSRVNMRMVGIPESHFLPYASKLVNGGIS